MTLFWGALRGGVGCEGVCELGWLTGYLVGLVVAGCILMELLDNYVEAEQGVLCHIGLYVSWL
jgi:hypothetical protein